MIKVYINEEKIREIANSLRKLEIKPDDFTDENYYPSINDDFENVAHYFFFMVAIDHRTSRGPYVYETEINGKKYHGADLLYKLGKMKYDEDREFFTPRKMAKINRKEVKKWLEINKLKLWDIETRVLLLRDAGVKLLKLFDGSIIRLLEISNGYLRPHGNKPGFLDYIKCFLAYSDPVEKKAFLLIKFLERRGILEVKDKENLNVPVDNHLTRIALRWGIIKVDDTTLRKIKQGIEFSLEEDVYLRMCIREAYKILSNYAKIKPTILDDFLWCFGRKICIRDNPQCSSCHFTNVCYAFNSGVLVNEHRFVNTWYY